MCSCTLSLHSFSAPHRCKISSSRIWLPSKIAKGRQGTEVFIEDNALYRLELILMRFVYEELKLIKEDPEIREPVLFLSDVLVDSGSSAAYRMRDDFVTPIDAEA